MGILDIILDVDALHMYVHWWQREKFTILYSLLTLRPFMITIQYIYTKEVY